MVVKVPEIVLALIELEKIVLTTLKELENDPLTADILPVKLTPFPIKVSGMLKFPV